jgi:predicted dehydrogenase/nucleoside-diphosphate-sugar epimerase
VTDILHVGTVAFIGCGKIAHIHMRFLQKVGYRVDAVCDASQVRVDNFAQQYGIKKQFTDVAELLVTEKPCIVHILTPPHTHHELIMTALKAGCNVLVEKPICQTSAEYHEIASLAAERGLLVSVDHTRVYNPTISAARDRIKTGEFGKIVKMDYAYDDPSLIKSANDVLGFRWAKGVPAWFSKVRGGVLTDLLPHPLSVMLSFDDELQTEHVYARTLRGGVFEDLSVMLKSDTVIATISLSVNQRPLKNVFSVYCEKGSIQVELRNMYAVYQSERRLPGIVSRVLVALTTAWQIATGFSVNVVKMVSGKSHPYDGLDQILKEFYANVAAGKGGDVPLINAGKVMTLVEDILCTALEGSGNAISNETAGAQQNTITSDNTSECLVLGGTGFIGLRVVHRLIDIGKTVRVFCRQSSNINRLPKVADISCGDLKDSNSLTSALSGIKSVIHCAAAMSGDWAEFYESTVQGTKNLLAAMENSQVERFVYISSLGVLEYNRLTNGSRVDESSPVEARPTDRGFYTRAKVEAEQLVREFAERNKQITTIILRPGLVYGQESNNNLQNCGILLDRFLLVFGLGKRSLGLNYVENLAQAVVLAGEADLASGTIIQVVDPEQPTVRDIIAEHNKLNEHKVTPLYIPVAIWKFLFLAVDVMLFFKNKKSGTFRYRFASNSSILYYCSDFAQKSLGRYSRYDFAESFSRTYQNKV